MAAAHPGVRVASTPKAVAEAADIVITMLPSGEYVRDVTLGGGGLIEGFAPGSILLDTSSCEPWITVETAAALAEVGVDMVDAPVSGAQAGAIGAELVFMVGGGDDAVARVSPLLDILGKQAFHLGPVGAGHAMKCINNLITAMTFMATAEGLTIGTRFGLDPEVMTDVLNVSTGMSWISKTHIKQRITNRAFDDPFRLELMVKDIGIASGVGGTRGTHPPTLGAWTRTLDGGRARCRGRCEHQRDGALAGEVDRHPDLHPEAVDASRWASPSSPTWSRSLGRPYS